MRKNDSKKKNRLLRLSRDREILRIKRQGDWNEDIKLKDAIILVGGSKILINEGNKAIYPPKL